MKQFMMAVAIMLAGVSVGFAHCQVPCGIYDDEMRLDMIDEHITTIGKAMKMITDLSDDAQPEYNQIVRWVEAKEEHADEIAYIVSWYFLQQRVKPVERSEGDAYGEYLHKVELLHLILVASMKAKQSTDLSYGQTLRLLLDDFSYAYLGE